MRDLGNHFQVNEKEMESIEMFLPPDDGVMWKFGFPTIFFPGFSSHHLLRRLVRSVAFS